MSVIELIPAVDILDGKCVRLRKGDYADSTEYFPEPSDAAMMFRDAGVTRIHVVDLDGARSAAPRNLDAVERIAVRTGLDVEFGGGIKTSQSLKDIFSCGARYAVCGSVAVTSPETFRGWLTEFSGDRIVLGADLKEGLVATHGWIETSDLGVEGILDSFAGDGLSQCICTDISRDGMLQGVDGEFYSSLQERYPDITLTVSGGISSMDDIRALNDRGLRRVIIGKAFYDGRITIKEIERWITQNR